MAVSAHHVAVALTWALSPALLMAQGPLTAGARLSRFIAASQADAYTINLEKGDLFRVEVREGDTDVAVTLFDPAGKELARSNSGDTFGGIEALAEEAAETGRYKLEVKLDGTQPGTYALTVRDLRPATAADSGLLAADRHFRAGIRLRRDIKTRGEAIREFEAAAAGFRDEPLRQAGALIALGLVQSQTGDLRESLSSTEQALELYRAQHDTSGEALAQGNLGVLLGLLGEPVRSRAAYQRALELHRARSNNTYVALMLNNLGALEYGLGRPAAALENYRQALPLMQVTRNARREALVRQNMGASYRALGEFESSEAFLQSALPLHRSSGNPLGEAQTLFALGQLSLNTGRTAQAADLYRQAIAPAQTARDRNAEAEIRSRLGYALALLGRHTEARTTFDQALALALNAQDRFRHATVLESISRGLLLAGEAESAAIRAGEALNEYRGIGARAGEASSLDAIARALNAQNHLAAARARIEEALAVLEDNRSQVTSLDTRASYFATQQDSFAFYIDLLMRLKEPALALAAVERYRARSLLDLLSESGADLRRGVNAQLLEQEQNIIQRLNAKAGIVLSRAGTEAVRLQQEIRDLDEERRQVQAQIRRSSPAYAALTQPRPLNVTQIQQQLLDDHTLLLEYSLGETRSYLWALGKQSLRFWELPAREALDQQVNHLYQLLTARATSPRGELPAERLNRIAMADQDLTKASATLAAVLLPAGAILPGKRMVIVPDGALQKLPFALLPISGGEPLGIAHELTVLPSASALSIQRVEISSRQPAPKMLAVFADPDFGSGASASGSTRLLEHLADSGNSGEGKRPRIPPLPFTRTEARDILALSRGGNFSALGRDATRERALNPDLATYRYLHFATHGYLDPERPGLSALVMAQDGFLRVNDIYQLRLPAELVVLSACQTGLGKEVRGEGVMSFTRAFMYAGAPRVIVSLWNVNDRATASLMAALYRGMLREGLTPSAALQRAQIEIRKQKQWESPYYWAAFVHFGEWK